MKTRKTMSGLWTLSIKESGRLTDNLGKNLCANSLNLPGRIRASYTVLHRFAGNLLSIFAIHFGCNHVVHEG